MWYFTSKGRNVLDPFLPCSPLLFSLKLNPELSSACGHVTVRARSQETSPKRDTVNAADQQHAQTKHSIGVVQAPSTVSSGQQGQIQVPEERFQQLIPSPSGPQMQTQDAEEEFVQVLISSPERIRVRRVVHS